MIKSQTAERIKAIVDQYELVPVRGTYLGYLGYVDGGENKGLQVGCCGLGALLVEKAGSVELAMSSQYPSYRECLYTLGLSRDYVFGFIEGFDGSPDDSDCVNSPDFHAGLFDGLMTAKALGLEELLSPRGEALLLSLTPQTEGSQGEG